MPIQPHRHEGAGWLVVADFRVDGIPKGQPRVKAFTRGKHAGVYTPATANSWKESIHWQAKQYRPEVPYEGPVRVWVDVEFPRPKYMQGKKFADGRIMHTAKPDRDNIDKAILDVLTEMQFFRDDAQVCGGEIRKFYHAKGERPGAWIQIEVLKEGGPTPTEPKEF